MSSLRNPRTSTARVLPLPQLDDTHVPAWRVVRYAVSLTLSTFAILGLAALGISALITMEVTVDGDGVVEPGSVWQVRSLDSGILSEILVRAGDSVVRGQLIARLDSTRAAGDVAEARARLGMARLETARLARSIPIESERARAATVEAEARVARARTELRQRMADFGVSGDPDSVARSSITRVHVGLDAPSADLIASQGQLASARAQVSAARLAWLELEQSRAEVTRLEVLVWTNIVRLGKQAIRAPADGVVLTDQPEQLVGSEVVAGQSFLEIADLRSWRASLAISEREVYRIHAGDEAEIEVPALGSMRVNRFRGRVEAVGSQPAGLGNSATSSPRQVAGYRVLVRLDSARLGPASRGLLRRGYVARGSIVTRSARPLALLIEYMRDRTRAIAH